MINLENIAPNQKIWMGDKKKDSFWENLDFEICRILGDLDCAVSILFKKHFKCRVLVCLFTIQPPSVVIDIAFSSTTYLYRNSSFWIKNIFIGLKLWVKIFKFFYECVWKVQNIQFDRYQKVCQNMKMCLKVANHVLFGDSKVKVCLVVKNENVPGRCKSCVWCAQCVAITWIKHVLFLFALKFFYSRCLCFWKNGNGRTDTMKRHWN